MGMVSGRGMGRQRDPNRFVCWCPRAQAAGNEAESLPWCRWDDKSFVVHDRICKILKPPLRFPIRRRLADLIHSCTMRGGKRPLAVDILVGGACM